MANQLSLPACAIKNLKSGASIEDQVTSEPFGTLAAPVEVANLVNTPEK